MNADAEVRRLARLMTSLQSEVRSLARASQARFRSVEGGGQAVYDEEGTLRQVVGQQDDGAYTVVDVNAPPPPVPSAPVVDVANPGVAVVSWDGLPAGEEAYLSDFLLCEVHRGDVAGFVTSDETQVTEFVNRKGGSVTLALPAGTHYFKLQAVNTSRVESAPSLEVEGIVVPPTVDAATGAATYHTPDEPIGLGAADDGALWYDTDAGNLPHRWDGNLLAWVAMPVGADAVESVYVEALQSGSIMAQIGFFGGELIAGDPVGARVAIGDYGLEAYNAAGVRTFNVDSATGEVTVVGQYQTDEGTKSRVEIGQAVPGQFYTSLQIIEFEVGDDLAATSPGQLLHASADQVTPGVSDTMATFLKTGYFADYAEALIELNSANSLAPSKMLLQAETIWTDGVTITRQEPWHYVGTAGEPNYENGWSASNPNEYLRFRLDVAGNCHIQGRAVKGTDNTVVFTLPVGYRPSELLRTQTLSSSSFDLCAVIIDVDGTVLVNWDTGAGTAVNLTIPPFYVES